jgi:hypothetical protein
MAYTINLTNGTQKASVADGTIDTAATDITLVGKNFTGYGEILNENYVHMLENFANTTAPTAPLTGQLWWNTDIGTLTVYDGSQFKAVSSSTVSINAPSGAVEGDLWWDSTNDQLNVYNGGSWVLIGPAFAAGSGVSGSIVEVIQDSGFADHVVVTTYVADIRIAIVSDNAFTPVGALVAQGFPTIGVGTTMVSPINLTGARFNGIATDSDALSGVSAASFLRSDVADIQTAGLSITDSAAGLQVGASNELLLNVTSFGEVQILNQVNAGNITISYTNGVGTIIPAIKINEASDGKINVQGLVVENAADPAAAQDVATKNYVDVATGVSIGAQALLTDGSRAIAGSLTVGTDSLYNIGTPTVKHATIYADTFNGSATEALYADVAERFEADAPMEAGTVVMLGGAKEICQANEDLSDDVFGVISTSPAHLMNAGAGTSATHPPIAMTGRVPVRVLGKIKKGDRLVSAGNGLARAAAKYELTSFNVIGRSLQDKFTEAEGVVEAIVNMNS